MDNLPEPRVEGLVRYEGRFLVCMAVLMRLLRLPSRRRLRFELRDGPALQNLNTLADTDHTQVAHDDTVAHLMEKMPPEGLRWLRTHIIRRLIRSRSLEKFRLLGKFYTVAVDGSGYLSFRRPHCPHCLEKEYPGGNTLYHHPVLEAKLVTPSGMALSLGTEFIENTEGQDTQECERRAFHRLIPRLRNRFPRLRMCLLLDALYLTAPVMQLCQDLRLHYITTFKKGSLPRLHRELNALLPLAPENRLEETTDGLHRRYRWMTDLRHKGHTLSALQCRETDRDGRNTRFLWATDFVVHASNVRQLALKGGRLRWKIENEGFNAQKNRGFGLGHPYSEDWNASKCFYLALQIAHIVDQLLRKSNLLDGDVEELFGSQQAFAVRLLEAWRNHVLPPPLLRKHIEKPYQIRLPP